MTRKPLSTTQVTRPPFGRRTYAAITRAILGFAHRAGANLVHEDTDRTAVQGVLDGQAFDVALSIDRYLARSILGFPFRSRTSMKNGGGGTKLQFVDGNSTRLVSSNEEDFRSRLELIENAELSIAATFWALKSDDTGRAFVHALRRKAEQGVSVTLILDLDTVRRELYAHPEYRELLDEIEQSRIDFHLLRHESYRGSHRKMMAVDRAHAIIGGRNIGQDYAHDDGPRRMNDVDIWFEGPAASHVDDLLHSLVGKEPADHQPVPHSLGADSIAVVDHRASFKAPDPVIDALIQSVREAQSSIDLAYAYLMSPPPLTRELIKAQERGVRIRALVNSQESVDFPFWDCAAYPPMLELYKKGISIYLSRSRLLHCKFCVIDQTTSFVGSHNMWPLSILHDHESTIVLRSEARARELLARMDELMADAPLIESEQSLVPSRGFIPFLAKRILWGM